MNIENIKKNIKNKVGKKVLVTVYGMRNKLEKYEGIIHKVYPNIFTILIDGDEKSFSYRDLLTNDIKVNYL